MWLYLPSTDSPSAPASACLTKACDLHSSILDSSTALSLTSKGKPLQPRATDGDKGGPNCRGGRGDPILPGQAAQWATPLACDARGSAGKEKKELPNMAMTWPTPVARDHKSEQGGGCNDELLQSAERPNPLSIHRTFAPGPSDEVWEAYCFYFPFLAPAVESGVCMLADGLAVVVDESRTDQLRAIGNGVVALTAACAYVQLARRAGFGC